MTLFQFAQDQYDRLTQHFRAYGMVTDPALRFEPGEGMLSYYDLERQSICLSLPDPDKPIGKLQLVLLQSTLDLPDRTDMLRLVRLLIPYVVAHELGHHFRHRYGRFSSDLWQEEQVANHLAIAATKTHISPEDKAFCLEKLPIALAALARQLDARAVPYTSYDNMLVALRVTGQIDETARTALAAVQRIFSLDEKTVLAAFQDLPNGALEDLDQRETLLKSINTEYANNVLRYLYYHLGWFQFSLASTESRYVEDFAKQHLGIARAMLPSPTLPKAPAEGAVLACGQAAVFLSKRSEALSTYFLRRYRALLVAHLVYSGLLSQDQADRLDSERVFLSELFEDDDLDPLNYLRSVLPKTKHALLPAVALTDVTLPLESDLADLQSLCELLPHDTDRRLWRVGAEGAIDQDALETLHGLEMFNSVDALKHLPARDIFDVIRTSTLVTLAPGDVLIWQGEWTRDVFLLLDGQLGIGRRAAEDGKNAKVREGVESTGTPDETIEPGEVIGEMSFLSAAPRRATITALAPSHCMVLKDADLRALIFDHPSILLTIAKRLAQRVWGQDGQ